MRAIINGKIVLENSVLENGCIIFDDKIQQIGTDLKVDGCDVIDAKNNFVMPGFIDIHIHGYKGFDVSDADENGIIEISKQIAKNGVTSWCPTTMTVEKSVIQKSLDIIKRLINSDKTGAKILGANVEGPFINPIKKGAFSILFPLSLGVGWGFVLFSIRFSSQKHCGGFLCRVRYFYLPRCSFAI